MTEWSCLVATDDSHVTLAAAKKKGTPEFCKLVPSLNVH